MDGHGVQQGGRDHFEDPHKPPPSPVVHVRGLSDSILEADLVDAVSQFGPVSFVMMMPRKRQALIEFEDIQGARTCVDYTQNSPLIVGGAPAYFNYSTSQKIQRPVGGQGEERPNEILLFTILNPQYPINVEVMHAICSPHGQVLRIVIFKKNGCQAMVEFADKDSARRAKAQLNGADIYSGCCTLKIEYAKQTRLNIFKNDSESWDYTNPNLGEYPEDHRHSGHDAPKNKPLLADPRFSTGPTPYNSDGPPRRGPPPMHGGYQSMDYQSDCYDGYGNGRAGGYGPDRYGNSYGMEQDRYGRPPSQYGGMSQAGPMDANGGQYGQGAVLMVYGLNMDHFNCNKLFNLFCLYGNVVRVKFLKSKEGSAMIQMGDYAACERAMKNLNYIAPFESKVQLGFSKQAFLQDVNNPHELRDGSPSFVDFMGSRNNRFATPQAAQKNRIQPPSRVLHYFNAPPSLTEEELKVIFEENGAKAPSKIKVFPAKSERSSTGLIEYEDKTEALEALILVNHTQIPNPAGKTPYIFKLCFSNNPIMS